VLGIAIAPQACDTTQATEMQNLPDTTSGTTTLVLAEGRRSIRNGREWREIHVTNSVYDRSAYRLAAIGKVNAPV